MTAKFLLPHVVCAQPQEIELCDDKRGEPAPVVAGEKYDVWSLGATLYEMCTVRRLVAMILLSARTCTSVRTAYLVVRVIRREVIHPREFGLMRCAALCLLRRYRAGRSSHWTLLSLIHI